MLKQILLVCACGMHLYATVSTSDARGLHFQPLPTIPNTRNHSLIGLGDAQLGAALLVMVPKAPQCRLLGG